MVKKLIGSKVSVTGDDFLSFVSVFKQAVSIEAKVTVQEFANEMKDEAIAILEDQRYKWQPLAESTAKAKEEAGLDPRILVATGFYKDHIESWVDEKGMAHVGPKPGVTHEPSGLPLAVLTRIHEFGTSRIPARPLWRPLLSVMMRRRRRFAKMYRKRVMDRIKKSRVKKL